jgi:hypothetical protein
MRTLAIAITIGLMLGMLIARPSSATQPVYMGTQVFDDITATGDIDATGDMSADEITANTHTGGMFNGAFYGDGTNLGNIPGAGTNLNLYLTNTLNGLDEYRQMTTDSSVLAEGMIGLQNTVTGAYSVLYNGISDTGIPGITLMPGGVYTVHGHASKTGIKDVELYAELLIYNGTGEELISTSETVILSTDMTGYDMNLIVPDTVISSTDRYVVHVFTQVSGAGGNPVVELHVEGTSASHLSAAGPNLSVDTFPPYAGAIKNVISTHGAQFDNLAVTPYHNGSLNINTVTVDWSNGGWQTFTMLNSITTLVSFTNVVSGGLYRLDVTQGGIGNGLISFSDTVATSGGTAIALTNAGGSRDILQFTYNGTSYDSTSVLNMQ